MKDAINDVQRKQIDQEIKDFISRYPDNDLDFTSQNPKAYIAWDMIENKPIIKTTKSTFANLIYFNSQYRAQKCIEHMSVDKIKMWLGVPDNPVIKKGCENNELSI